MKLGILGTSEIKQFFRILHISAKWFLQQNVFASQQSFLSPFIMQSRRQRNIYRANTIICQQIRICGYPVRLAMELLGAGTEVVQASLIQPLGYEVDLYGSAVLSANRQIECKNWSSVSSCIFFSSLDVLTTSSGA